jgi:hypothetical protein
MYTKPMARIYTPEQKAHRKAYYKSYYKKNKQQMDKASSVYHKTYRKTCRKKLNRYSKKYFAKRYQRDPIFRLKHNLRGRIRIAIRQGVRSARTAQLLGASFDIVQQYLTALFRPGMSWDNYGKWHVDHIQPCDSFDLSKEDQQRQCFHYTNLQPLWAKDNLIKGAKLQTK